MSRLADFEPLYLAERRPIDGQGQPESAAGVVVIFEGAPSEAAGPERPIRAALARYLMRGGWLGAVACFSGMIGTDNA